MPPQFTNDAFKLAQAAHQAGRLDEAEIFYRQLLAESPQHANALHMLGIVRFQRGDAPGAVELLQRSIALKPDLPQAHSNLSVFLLHLQRRSEAIAAARTATQLKPDFADAWNNLGNALFQDGQIDAAIEALERSIQLNPNPIQTQMNYGNVMKKKGDYDRAIAAYRQSTASPNPSPEALTNLANALKDTGQLEEALALYRRAVQLAPNNPTIHSNLLYGLHFHPDSTPQSLAAEHRLWDQRHGSGRIAPPQHPPRDRSLRPLRIGYVSPDLGFHPVGRFMLPILAHHDRSQFEIFVYSDAGAADQLTARLRAAAPDHWHETNSLSHEELAHLIRSHKIDILVDLTMHMARNRMLLFAQKPAPIQITYLAYCSTTGLAAMDYRLSDPHLDPPPINPAIYREKTLHLPQTYWCYQMDDPPQVGPLPARSRGFVTFACLNNFGKVTVPTLATWARILQNVPASHLLLYAGDGSHRQRTRHFFAARGIDSNRIEFTLSLPFADYCKLHHRIDIALDPFPCVGGTTSCDALSMGVPVVTLAGNTAVGRGGVSILRNLNLPELIATTTEEYTQIAAGLAADLPRLENLRAGLRERLQDSPLAQAPTFTKNLESLYRAAWQK